jgi:CRP/FNR family cyclic AMP-dependent transcriptional regulator
MPIDCDFRIFLDRPRETVSLRPGEFLFREGDAADALYIVSRGTLRIMSGIAVYEVVEAGGIVGEMSIVEEDKPRSASVISSTHTELIKVDRPTFREMVRDTPDFALMVMRVMARRLRIMNQRYRPQAAAW